VEGHGAEPMNARELAVWRDALGRVLAGRDLEIVTQPIVDLQAGSVVGYEALTRFPGAPSADPGVWFAVAEQFGVSPELMAATLRRQLGLAEHLPKGCLLAVKVSCLGLDADAVQPVLEQAPLEDVVVELDEAGRFGTGDDPGDLTDLADLVERLRAGGARIAVTSDGGAGVPAILELGPDIVRIGRTMIDGIDRDGEQRALLVQVRSLLDARNARLLAHGIESRGELDALVDLGVPLGQGFFIGRPGPGWARPQPLHGPD
jgi:EAL domain-containing protein (putative c-di-GMP-specific phosphodiesterase class I)